MRSRSQLLASLIAVCLLTGGCKPRDKNRSVFRQEPCDYVLLIAVSEEVTNNDRAFEFVCYAIDQYFQDRGPGANDQVIISRIEGERPLVWQGTPRNLRLEFPSAEEFRRHLSGTKAPGSLHDGLSRSIKLLLETYSVSQSKAKAVTMVLSDMNDDHPSAEANDRFIDTLVDYCRRNGAIGFYFCDQLRFEEVREKTKKAGLGWVTLEPDVHGRPPLPSFE